MVSIETPIVKSGSGPRGHRVHLVADRANRFHLGQVARVEIPSTSGRPVVQWMATLDTGRHAPGPFRRRVDAVGWVWREYRRWDTVRYACGRMAA